MSIELDPDDILDLFELRMRSVGIEIHSSRGTYNRADPTEFKKFDCVVTLDYGISLIPADEEDVQCGVAGKVGDLMPKGHERIHVDLVDCTWGVEVVIQGEDKISHSAYLSRPCGNPTPYKWLRPTERFFEVFKLLLTQAEQWKTAEQMEMEYIDDRMLANAR